MVPNFETRRVNRTCQMQFYHYHSYIAIFVSPALSVLEIGILFHWKSRQDAERVPSCSLLVPVKPQHSSNFSTRQIGNSGFPIPRLAGMMNIPQTLHSKACSAYVDLPTFCCDETLVPPVQPTTPIPPETKARKLLVLEGNFRWYDAILRISRVLHDSINTLCILHLH
jgi:hypothetical protein